MGYMQIRLSTSYTKWAADLKENHLHAILSGFPVGHTPGVGTFYDFQMSDKNNLSDPVHPPKQKPRKPDKKKEKLHRQRRSL